VFYVGNIDKIVTSFSCCNLKQISSSSGLYNLVPKAWLKAWRGFTRDPGVLSPPVLDCSSMLCQAHGMLVVPAHVEDFLLGTKKTLLAGLGTNIFLYVSIYVYSSIFLYMNIYKYSYTNICGYINRRIYICICLLICIGGYPYMGISEILCVDEWEALQGSLKGYTYIYVYIYIYMYEYTHIHNCMMYRLLYIQISMSMFIYV
jgi:hypothetical protein